MRNPDLDYRFYWQMVGPSLTKIVMYFNWFFLEECPVLHCFSLHCDF